jgi:hypothetical protein
VQAVTNHRGRDEDAGEGDSRPLSLEVSVTARGVLYVHSAPAALCPHVEWAVAAVLGMPARLEWAAQPAGGSTLRAECCWQAPPGTAARIARAMNGWRLLRFEVTEEPSAGCDGERYAYTPALGLFRTPMSANGDVLVGEGRLRALLASTDDGGALAAELERLLGTPWDQELEVYRHAGEGAPVRWLHQVG